MAVAKLMTSAELAEAMIGLIDKGLIIAVWNTECSELAFWPTGAEPADVQPVSADEVRAYFARIGERIFPQWN